jgi:apolipoprotein N-acyltransferase
MNATTPTKNPPLIIHVVLSAFFLFAAWPTSNLTGIIFFALVPLLYLWEQPMGYWKKWILICLTFLLWNTATTWWIWNAAPVGAISAIVLNSIFMTAPYMWANRIRKNFNSLAGQIALLLAWMSFEYLHLNWEFNWPWLNLGNVFAQKITWIQWYEFTGTAGGTLWVMLVNLLLYNFMKHNLYNKFQIKMAWPLLLIAALIALPIIYSQALFTFNRFSQKGATRKTAIVVQPNQDPYQKFNPELEKYQIEKLLKLTSQQLDSSVALVLYPETGVPGYINEINLRGNSLHDTLFNFVAKHPYLNILTGINSYSVLQPNEEKKSYSSFNKANNFWYNEFNTAALINNQSIQLYHKSKLVPGVEIMPYINVLSFLRDLVIDLGGGGLYGTQDTATVFTTNNNIKIAPLVCYETAFGNHVAKFVKKDAQVLGVVTNDAWWGNTPGHKQLLAYTQLRAIETRRPILRSANTGISCLINTDGTIAMPQPFNTQAAVRYNFTLNNRKTFYVQYGDYLFIIAATLFGVIFIYQIGYYLFKKFTK